MPFFGSLEIDRSRLIRDLDDRGNELPIDELVAIACEGPMSRYSLNEGSQAKLIDYLEAVGGDEPQACRP